MELDDRAIAIIAFTGSTIFAFLVFRWKGLIIVLGTVALIALLVFLLRKATISFADMKRG